MMRGNRGRGIVKAMTYRSQHEIWYKLCEAPRTEQIQHQGQEDNALNFPHCAKEYGDKVKKECGRCGGRAMSIVDPEVDAAYLRTLLTACDPRNGDGLEPNLIQETADVRCAKRIKGYTSRNRRKCERTGESMLCEGGSGTAPCERTAVAETTPPPAHGRLSRQRDRSRSTRARMLSSSHRSFPLSQRASIYSQAVGRRCNTDRTQAARSLQRSSTYVYFHTVQAFTLPHSLPRRRPPCDIFDLQTLA